MAAPRRIASLVPSLTEALFDLGAGARVVGVTDYCPLPPKAGGIRRVGGPRTPDLNAIIDLRPDLVIAVREENSKENIEWIRGRLPVEVFECRTFDDGLWVVEALGRITERTEAAAEVVRRLTSARGVVCGRAQRERSVFYPIWKKPWMTVSTGTFVASMLEAAGGISIFRDRSEPYPTVRLEQARRRAPDLVLLPDEPYVFGPDDRGAFRDFAAFRTGGVRCVPGRWAAWYGTRMDQGLAGLYDAIQGPVQHESGTHETS